MAELEQREQLERVAELVQRVLQEELERQAQPELEQREQRERPVQRDRMIQAHLSQVPISQTARLPFIRVRIWLVSTPCQQTQ